MGRKMSDPPSPILSTASTHRVFGKGFLAMSRLLVVLALTAVCLLSSRAPADTLKPSESAASEISSRQRCACTWRGPTRFIHHRRYWGVRRAYLIGYDPLPYRFGSASVWARPYRYYWR